jgi:hypothetical protein
MIHISANAVKQTLYKSEVLVILNDLFVTFFWWRQGDCSHMIRMNAAT